MQTKHFDTYEELENFVQPMIDEKKWAIDIRADRNQGGYRATWIEHKSYTSHDGQVFPDEIWVTADGDLKCVQDMDPEHAKNALRMLLRNEREQRAMIEAALQQIAGDIAEEEFGETDDVDVQAVPTMQSGNRTVH